MDRKLKPISINNRLIGDGFEPYIVAEISANHNGDINKALAIMTAAKKTGADAVKLQSYTPDTITLNCTKPDFMIKEGLWKGYNLYDLYKEAYTPFEWHKDLFDHAHNLGITCFSTPFDKTSVDLLEDLNSPAYKIASFEAIDIPLIKYVAQTQKPMIISTGMANEEEIKEAVDTAKAHGCGDVIVLHCISAYPAPIKESNLKTMLDISKRYSVLTGLSDHTLGVTTSVAAVALGACFIEKHFTLNRNDKGPDSVFSLEPTEFENLCISARDAWLAIGEATYLEKESEKSNLMFRRSLYFVNNAKKGELISSSNVRSIRPGFGLPPKYYDSIIGKTLLRDAERGDPVLWEHIK